MNVILNGALGRMGRAVENRLSERDDMKLVARIDALSDNQDVKKSISECKEKADVIIDFSHHTATAELLSYAVENNVPVVLCTTGHTDDEKRLIEEASKKIAVFRSANMSIGVAVLCDFAKKAAAMLPDAEIEIVERHHDQKLDAPSGTALMIAEEIKEARSNAEFVCGRNGRKKREKNEIGIHALRLGNIVGEHEVVINTGLEQITLKHEAFDRSLFADGAIAAAAFLCGKEAGSYDMKSIVTKD